MAHLKVLADGGLQFLAVERVRLDLRRRTATRAATSATSANWRTWRQPVFLPQDIDGLDQRVRLAYLVGESLLKFVDHRGVIHGRASNRSRAMRGIIHKCIVRARG